MWNDCNNEKGNKIIMNVLEALAILGLKRGCKKEDLKPAYRKMAMKCHPDKHGGCPKATAKMKKLNEAYEVCRNYEPHRYRDPGPQSPTNDRFTWVGVDFGGGDSGNNKGGFTVHFDFSSFNIRVK